MNKGFSPGCGRWKNVRFRERKIIGGIQNNWNF